MSKTLLPPVVRRQVLDLAQHARDPKQYQCAGCRKYFAISAVEIDHIIPESESTPEDRVNPDNLQVLCNPKGSTRLTSCHKAKTAREAADRARRNRVPRNWWPFWLYLAAATITGTYTWQEVFRHRPESAKTQALIVAAAWTILFCTILVKNGFQHRRPRRSVSAKPVSPSVAQQDDGSLDPDRIREAFREKVGAKGNVSVSVRSRDQFVVTYSGTGLDDHKDEERFDVLRKVTAKIGDRWLPDWDTEHDRVSFSRRPPLPKIIHHPGLEEGRPWHVLPIADGVAFDLMQTSHLLIIGETNSGKTAMLRAITCAASDSASRKEVRLILVDPKRVEMVGFRSWPGVQRIVTKPEDLWDVAFMIQREMERRYTAYEERGVPLDSHQKWICIFDEFKAYADRVFDVWTSGGRDEDGEPFKRPGEKIPSAIRALADVIAMARKCGIHIIISTQSPDASIFGTSGVRQNLAGRATVGAIDGVRALMIYGRSDVGRDVPSNAKGRATVQIGDGKPVEIQTYWVPDPADADPNYSNTQEDWETLLRLGMPKELIST